MELPKQPDPSDFIDENDWLRSAYHDALAAWKLICQEIIKAEHPILSTPVSIPVPEFDYIDGKHGADNRPRYSQIDMDRTTKPLHAEIERLKTKCDGHHAGQRCADPECWNQ